MNLARFWVVFFSLIAISFGIRIILKKKGIDKGRIGLITKLVIASLPVFLFLMWNNNAIAINAKIINTLIGIFSMALGIGYIFVERRKDDVLK